MVQQARRESVKADDLVRSLTPRPNWHKLNAFAPAPVSPAVNPAQQPNLGKAQAATPITAQIGNAKQPSHQAVQHAQQVAQQAGVATGTTRDMVDQLVAERKQALVRVAELEPAQGQLQQALHLLQPEAGPSCVQLQLMEPTPAESQPRASVPDAPTVASAATGAVATPRGAARTAARSVTSSAVASSSTEAATAASTTAGAVAAGGIPAAAADMGSTQVVKGLGWGNSVPRYLRWDSPVALQPYSLPGLYTKIQDIWAAKAGFDGQHQAQQPLLGFLWTYFRAEHGEQGVVAQEGYSFLHALRQHQHQLPMAGMFLRVLEGGWQEAIWHDCRHMLAGVAAILEALSEYLGSYLVCREGDKQLLCTRYHMT